MVVFSLNFINYNQKETETIEHFLYLFISFSGFILSLLF